MNFFKPSVENMNDVVFENRNKLYGAYAIRNSYSDRVLKSLFLALLFFTSLALIPYVISLFSSVQLVKIPILDGPKIITFDSPKTKPDPVQNIEKPVEANKTKSATPDESLTTKTTVTDTKTAANPTITDNPNKTTPTNTDNNTAANGTQQNGPTAAPFDSTGYYKNLAPLIDGMADVAPQFPGGVKGLDDYLKSHIHFTDRARAEGISGTMGVSFVVSSDGSITDVSVIRPVGGGCAEIASAAVKNMPKWTPGKYKGHDVKVRMILPVSFKLTQ